ncbi:MAG: hypothetical protein VXV81_03035 [Candidatus Thermoplasmatota archaeon]|nr:hypothetical protein [Candidatus Thermoplasmatota archaeon]
MSLLMPTVYFSSGFIISFLFPRLPIILVTRGKGFNTSFPEHPDPVPLSPKLTQRVLHMRMIYWMGFVVATIPLLFGLASIKWGNVAFGFGLWISSGWYILSRLQTFVGGQKPPWTLDMAQRLQVVMDDAKSEAKCCYNPLPQWDIMAVSCTTCSKVLDAMPRPDLGRKRLDGFFLGTTRLLLSDGYPIISSDEDKRSEVDDSEE